MSPCKVFWGRQVCFLINTRRLIIVWIGCYSIYFETASIHNTCGRNRSRIACTERATVYRTVVQCGSDIARYLTQTATTVEIACYLAASQRRGDIVCLSQREWSIFEIETGHVTCWTGKVLVFVAARDTLTRSVFSTIGIFTGIIIATTDPTIEIIILNFKFVVVLGTFPIDRSTTIASTEESSENTIGGCSHDGLFGHHITELRTTAEYAYMTILNRGTDVTSNLRTIFNHFQSTAIKTFHVGMVNQPCDIAINILLSGTGHFPKLTTINIAFCIVITATSCTCCCIRTEIPRKV